MYKDIKTTHDYYLELSKVVDIENLTIATTQYSAFIDRAIANCESYELLNFEGSEEERSKKLTWLTDIFVCQFLLYKNEKSDITDMIIDDIFSVRRGKGILPYLPNKHHPILGDADPYTYIKLIDESSEAEGVDITNSKYEFEVWHDRQILLVRADISRKATTRKGSETRQKTFERSVIRINFEIVKTLCDITNLKLNKDDDTPVPGLTAEYNFNNDVNDIFMRRFRSK